MSSQNPRCSIVIPVYGNAHLTKACLDSVLRQQTPFETQIIVVDDASPDDTLAMLATYGDRIEVVRRPVNGGYAKACNSGLDAARGDFVLFLNNDTEGERPWLATIVAYAEAHPRAGVVGCRLLYPDGRTQHAGVGFTSRRLPVHLYAGFPGDAPFVSRNRVLQAVTGAVSLSPRFVLGAIGGYDDQYVNEFEDVDLCLAVRELGYEVHYCGEAIVTHRESSTRFHIPTVSDANVSRMDRKWGDSRHPDLLRILEEDGLAGAESFRPGRIHLDYDPRWITCRRRQEMSVSSPS